MPADGTVRAVKLVTWNINSIRARHERFFEWLGSRQPDVLCLQEIKCTDKEFPFADFEAAGYQVAIHGQKTYNGVAIAVKRPLELADVTRGFADAGDESQSRCIAATVAGVRVVSVYVPNGQAVGSDKYAYKLDWYARLEAYVAAQLAQHPELALVGDFNVAPQPEDVHDPAAWEGQVLFSPLERAALAAVCSVGLDDVLRRLHPTGQFFTWWDYRMLAFPKNNGLRIDLILTNPAAHALAVSTHINRSERKGQAASDHAPVHADFR
jgi:exodeoxyribonuclease-3